MTENVEYEVDFVQDQRKIDDGNDEVNQQSVVVQDNFGVVDISKLTIGSGEWQVQNKKGARSKIIFDIKRELQSEDVMSDEEEAIINDLWQLPLQDRWRLYRKWARKVSKQHQNTIASFQEQYDEGMKEMKELYNAKNYEILRDAHVIGMTTTGNFFLTILLSIIFLKGRQRKKAGN